ncbi:MAG: hypothetical protein J6D47_14300 [Peptostreptococcaceae bacterium]|nr:hypothetical protein [Peptostreptococcaceae bacterium]
MCVNHCFEKTLNYCSPGHGGWGLIRIAAIIPESHLLFICPSACFRHGALGAVQHGYKNRTSYLAITPADVVIGYDNLISESADELLSRDKSIKVLFLFVPCMDDFIGTDIESIAKEVENKHPNVVVRACHMNPVAVETNRPHLVTTLESMYSTIETENHSTEDAVNICGSFAKIEEECDLFNFLGDFGISVRQLADYEKYENFTEMGRSKYNLLLHPAAKSATKYMDKKFKTSTVEYLISYDIDEIRENYENWEKLLCDKHSKVEKRSFDIDKEEEETKDLIEKAVKKVNGTPISVSNTAVLRPFSLAKALIKYGFNVSEVISQRAIPSDKDAYEYILNNHPEVKIIQPAHHKNAVRNNEDTNMIAIGFEGAYLRQSDYVVDLSGDEGMYGYYGVRKLMEMIDKSVDEKADLKKMIDEYGAVV